jgi:hypothetical protein
MTLRRVAGALAYLVVLVVSTTVLLEGTLRMLYPRFRAVRLALWDQRDAAQLQYIATLEDLKLFAPVMVPPGADFVGMKVDEHGFWTPPYRQEKALGTLRLIVLGDSFSYSSGGVPFERAWPSLTATGLSLALGKPVELINLGIPAGGTRLEKRIFEIEGARLSPDLVVLQFFIGNDLSDEEDDRGWLLRHSLASRFYVALSRLPSLVGLLHGGWNLITTPPNWAPGSYVYDRTVPSYPLEHFRMIQRFRAGYFLPETEEWTKSKLEEAAGVIADLQRKVEAVGARFAVVTIPDELQVSAPLREDIGNLIATETGTRPKLRSEEVQRDTAEIFRRHGLTVIDPLPALLAEARRLGESPYRPRDTHLDDRGNAVLARVLAEDLARVWRGDRSGDPLARTSPPGP